MPFIYSAKYHADIGPHVFPIEKYRLVYEKLAREGQVPETEFLEPQAATDEELLLVHTREYLDDLKHCRWTHRTMYSELPISKEIIELFILVAGGTILACREALAHRWAVHLGGGFHHAFPSHGEGFCYVNDLAVAIRVVQREGLIRKAAVIDCDLHQGNGTAVIFRDDDSVFTFSIHQQELYPIKQQSDLDIPLRNGVGDEEYLDHLRRAIPSILDDFKPELVLYQAGADPYEGDQLGNLKLTLAGLQQRDEYIFKACRQRRLPVAVTLGGGYAYRTEDTVQIHYQTCLAARELLR